MSQQSVKLQLGSVSSKTCENPAGSSTDLSILDGISCSRLEQLDGLIVVQSFTAFHHVTQELHAVQLPVRILWPGVVHEADLRMGNKVSSETEQLHLWRL